MESLYARNKFKSAHVFSNKHTNNPLTGISLNYGSNYYGETLLYEKQCRNILNLLENLEKKFKFFFKN
jgi:hypothetical protein